MNGSRSLEAAHPLVVVSETLGEEEEQAGWENFASETLSPAAKDDTAPHTVRTPRPGRGEQLAKRKQSFRLGIVVGALTVALVAIIAILLAKFVLTQQGGGHPGGRAPLTVSRD